MGTEGRLGVLIGHVDLYLTPSLKQKSRVKKKKLNKIMILPSIEQQNSPLASGGVTWGVLAVVFIQFYQNWRGHHQEVTQRHSDGVRHHRKALTQTTQALKKQTLAVKFH